MAGGVGREWMLVGIVSWVGFDGRGGGADWVCVCMRRWRAEMVGAPGEGVRRNRMVGRGEEVRVEKRVRRRSSCGVVGVRRRKRKGGRARSWVWRGVSGGVSLVGGGGRGRGGGRTVEGGGGGGCEVRDEGGEGGAAAEGGAEHGGWVNV